MLTTASALGSMRDTVPSPGRHPDGVRPDGRVDRGRPDADRPHDLAAVGIDAGDRPVVCVGYPDGTVPHGEGHGPTAHEHMADYPALVRIDDGDRVRRDERRPNPSRRASYRPLLLCDRQLKRGIVVENRSLEQLERLVRIEAQLLGQQAPALLIDGSASAWRPQR